MPTPQRTPSIFGTALPGLVQILQHERSPAFGNNEPVPVPVKGPEAFLGSSFRVDRARMEAKAATENGVRHASTPPAIMQSASPAWMSRMATANRMPARCARRGDTHAGALELYPYGQLCLMQCSGCT